MPLQEKWLWLVAVLDTNHIRLAKLPKRTLLNECDDEIVRLALLRIRKVGTLRFNSQARSEAEAEAEGV